MLNSHDKIVKNIKGIAVVIGDEVLFGDVQDVNTSYIGKILLENGFSLYEVIISSDSVDELSKVLRYAVSNADFVITSGGLGPTKDDCTRKGVALAFGLELKIDELYRQAFKDRLRPLSIPWNDEFEDMTRLPLGSTKLAIDKPMAGFKLRVNDTPLYCLPGVPEEVQYLMQNEVIPDLKANFPERPYYKRSIIRVYNLHEWEIAKKIENIEILDSSDISVGYLPKLSGEVWITLFVKKYSKKEAEYFISEAQREIINMVGRENISGIGEEGRLEALIGRLLREKGWKLAVSESCTGGLLAETIVSVPGASDYFERGYIVYSNESKIEVLGVDKEVLEKYGAVSEPVAREMAQATCRLAKVDIALSTTGIAGPSGGSKEKPVGTVFIGCAVRDKVTVRKYLFSGSRRNIQLMTVNSALKMLWETLR